MCRVNFQPGLPSFSAAARAASTTSAGMPASSASSVTNSAKALVASSRFSENFACSAGEFLLDGLEARLVGFRQFGAGEAEVADLVLDDALLRGGELRESGTGLDCLELGEQLLVLSQLGEEARHLRQVGVVGFAPVRHVHHGVQVADDAPGARQALAAVEERRGEVTPGGRRRFQARQQGAVFRQQFADGGRDMFGIGRCFGNDLSRKFRSGRLLVPVQGFQVVADELLVEAGRADAFLVFGRPARSARNPASGPRRSGAGGPRRPGRTRTWCRR
jgi:hypothetical protein